MLGHSDPPQSGAVTCSLVRFCEPCCPHRLAPHEPQEDQGLTTQSRGTHLPSVGEKQTGTKRKLLVQDSTAA